MRQRRILLAALLVTATVAFVVGVSIESSSGEEHHAAATGEAGAHEEGGVHEEAGGHDEAAETGSDETAGETFLGIDYEATRSFIISRSDYLALAAGVLLRPGWLLWLAVVALAMLVFAALDVREVVHQIDESKEGLAVLAGIVPALYLTAATVAGRLASSPG